MSALRAGEIEGVKSDLYVATTENEKSAGRRTTCGKQLNRHGIPEKLWGVGTYAENGDKYEA
jgi:hypothetical protein